VRIKILSECEVTEEHEDIEIFWSISIKEFVLVKGKSALEREGKINRVNSKRGKGIARDSHRK
jgi:hypothetical protein